LYLHVFDWPKSGKLSLPALSNKLRKTVLLVDAKTELKVDTTGNQWVIEIPETAADPIATVIKVDVQGMPELSKD